MLAIVVTLALAVPGGPVAIQDEIRGEPEAIDFVKYVIDRNMYSLPAAGMNRALITARVSGLEAMFQDVSFVLAWQKTPPMAQSFIKGITPEQSAGVRDLAQRLLVDSVLRSALLRPTSDFLRTHAVSLEDDGKYKKLTFTPKVRGGATLSRWYREDGTLIRESTKIPGPKPMEVKKSFDIAVLDGKNVLRVMTQDVAGSSERWEYHYGRHGKYHVLDRVIRAMSLPEGRVEVTYDLDIKINEEITDADMKGLRDG